MPARQLAMRLWRDIVNRKLKALSMLIEFYVQMKSIGMRRLNMTPIYQKELIERKGEKK